MVLNKCTSTNVDRNVRPDSKEFAVTFNYQFLEDGEQVAELVTFNNYYHDYSSKWIHLTGGKKEQIYNQKKSRIRKS